MENLLESNNNIGDSNIVAARELHSLGFNVFPLQLGTKRSIGQWKILQATRLPESWPKRLFEDRNVGVLVGRTSMNLFVVDCDSNEAFNHWAEKLHDEGLDKWVVSSYNGGHFWFLSGDGEVRNIYKKRKGNIIAEEDYQIWGRNHYMVAPPSIRMFDSQQAYQYTWMKREGELPPVLPACKIESIFSNTRVVHPLREGNMTDLAYQVIVKHSNKKHSSFSEAELAAITSLLRIGWNDEEIIDLFNTNQPPHYLKKNSDETWLLNHMILPAKRFLHKDKNNALQNAQEWAEERKWEGRTKITDYLVFGACIDRASVEGTYRFRATIREVADMINLSEGTVQSSLNRLVTNGFLCLDDKKPNTAFYYRLSKNVITYHSIENTLCNSSVALSTTLRKHDVWHVYGLGKKALFVYEHLLDSRKPRGESINEITVSTKNRIGAKRVIVKTTLLCLKEHGLVKEENGKWIAVYATTEKLDEIAEKKGVLGTLKKKVARHKQELANFALFSMMTKINSSRENSNEDEK